MKGRDVVDVLADGGEGGGVEEVQVGELGHEEGV